MLAVPGLALTFWQVLQAKSAASAAQAAAETATSQFRRVSASSITSQLVHMEDVLRNAIDQRSADLLAFAITWWKWQAGQCRSFLDTSIPSEAEFEVKIQKSIVDATKLKTAMSSFDSDTDWIATTRPLRRSIGEVTSEVGALAASQSLRNGENHDG